MPKSLLNSSHKGRRALGVWVWGGECKKDLHCCQWRQHTCRALHTIIDLFEFCLCFFPRTSLLEEVLKQENDQKLNIWREKKQNDTSAASLNSGEVASTPDGGLRRGLAVAVSGKHPEECPRVRSIFSYGTHPCFALTLHVPMSFLSWLVRGPQPGLNRLFLTIRKTFHWKLHVSEWQW